MHASREQEEEDRGDRRGCLQMRLDSGRIRMIGTLRRIHSAINLKVDSASALATRTARQAASEALFTCSKESILRTRAAPGAQVPQGKDARTPSTAEARTQPVRAFRT
eukprot:5408036-Pyramimonas_sp.AAC.1